MTKELHKNFYENLEEMQRRLLNSVVTYDGEPVRIVAITNHKPDGIFRIYAWPVQYSDNRSTSSPFPREIDGWRPGSNEQAAYLDAFLEQNKNTPLMRKTANSPSFNKFRPFPLGMMNSGKAMYLERSPERRVNQGLISNMVETTQVGFDKSGMPPMGRPHLTGPEFYDCVKGNHPSAAECMTNLLDPSVEELPSVAFHRHFAFVRGPLDTFFLQYKTDVVGFVPADRRPQVELGAKYKHLREVVEETKQFETVRVRS